MEFYGIVFLVSSVSLFEPLNVHIDDDLDIWLFWQIFSSIALNNYHIQCHISHEARRILDDWTVDEF